MKLQPASRKELRRITLGSLICDGILLAGLFLLSLVGVGSFSLSRVLLGIFGGTLIAIVNFAILCLTVQSAVELDSKRKQKARFQLSYNLRMVLQGIWLVAALLIPQIHFIAGAAPVFFPNAVILYLQSRNRLVSPSQTAAAPVPGFPDDEEPEDHLGSFEF